MLIANIGGESGQNAELYYDWSSSSELWRYVAVTFQRNKYDYILGIGRTTVTMYIDGSAYSPQDIPFVFEDDGTYTSRIGYNFFGNIRYFRILNGGFCNALISPMVQTSACNALGTTLTCSMCEYEIGECFSECDLNTYDENCSPCHWKCKYCDAATDADCLLCDDDAMTFNDGTGNCVCAVRYVELNNMCTPCHSDCAICNDDTNLACDACSADSFLLGGSICVSQCPYAYTPDDVEGMCHFDLDALLSP